MTTPSAFFPEAMAHVEFAAPTDAAYHLVRELATEGNVELIDVHARNLSVQKRYSESYMQCEEADRSLGFLEQALRSMPDALPPAPAFVVTQSQLNALTFADVIERIRSTDADVREKVRIYEELTQQQIVTRRKLQCLRFFMPLIERENDTRNAIISAGGSDLLELSFLGETSLLQNLTGLVQTNRFMSLYKTIYRISRRNAIVHLGTAVGDWVPYSVFLQSSTLTLKTKSVCQSYSPDVYEFPPALDALRGLEAELTATIEQQDAVERQTRNVNHEFLVELGQEFWGWKAFIARERMIYATMDYGDFDRAEGNVIYCGWVPDRFAQTLHSVIQRAQTESGSAVAVSMQLSPAAEKEGTDIVIPTFIEENDFNSAFQSLNDAYGVPNYDEVNGGAFYCMYPFLFGIMFGDMGHALFYLIAAVALLILDPVVKRMNVDLGEMGGAVFGFKWLLLFAALCAFYCGALYNEAFGLPLSIGGTAYTENVYETSAGVVRNWSRNAYDVRGFGMDPVWMFKDNELIFLNSFKMKLAVVMGMCQMVCGMFLSLIKHVHRRDWIEILIVWLPEMMYLVPFFGYLVVIIVIKWCTNFKTGDYPPEQKENGVNLIQVMIGMLLNFGSKPEDLRLYGDGQWGVQTGIIVVFVISIPLLLLVKPIVDCVHLSRAGKEFNVLEVFVMNLIHVIEFCLGAMSHTASYLRLWALSLAHSQLSHVVYEQLFMGMLKMDLPAGARAILMFVCWAAFAVLTVAILLGMEAFSALLHAIRLMWVEFSSKFYEGMGTAFKPLSLKAQLLSVGIH
jgi:V-type H+-transporting ATPase subunit a